MHGSCKKVHESRRRDVKIEGKKYAAKTRRRRNRTMYRKYKERSVLSYLLTPIPYARRCKSFRSSNSNNEMLSGSATPAIWWKFWNTRNQPYSSFNLFCTCCDIYSWLDWTSSIKSCGLKCVATLPPCMLLNIEWWNRSDWFNVPFRASRSKNVIG